MSNENNYNKSSEIDKILNADYNNAYNRIKGDCDDIFSQAAKSLNEIYNQASTSFTKYYGNMFPYVPNTAIGIGHPVIGYPYQVYTQIGISSLPQMIDITDKKAFIVLGIFEYDSVPHDMKLLIFAENEEKARELIDETYSTDTSFFMVKNIKEA